MAPLFITLGNRLPLMIIPDSQAHLNGQTILTYTYSIFLDIAKGDPKQSKSKENFLHLERIKDPDYYGFITYQNSGLLPLYKADGYKKLSSDELSEVIERLTDENSV